MIDSSLPLFPANCSHQINDISSGLFTMFQGLGQILGSIYGAKMTERYGFKTCCDSVALFCLAFSVVYFTFGDGKQAFKTSKWKHETHKNKKAVLKNYDDRFTKVDDTQEWENNCNN